MLPKCLGTIKWKILGKTHRPWGRTTLGLLWFLTGKIEKGDTANKQKVKVHLPTINEGRRQQGLEINVHAVCCLLIPAYRWEGHLTSAHSCLPGSSMVTASLLQRGHWNEPIQTWRRQQTCNNLFVATELPGPIPSPISIHTPPYCSPDNDRPDCNCWAALWSGRGADKEYLSLLSAQMCKSLFKVLWGTEQNSCFHWESRC